MRNTSYYQMQQVSSNTNTWCSLTSQSSRSEDAVPDWLPLLEPASWQLTGPSGRPRPVLAPALAGWAGPSSEALPGCSARLHLLDWLWHCRAGPAATPAHVSIDLPTNLCQQCTDGQMTNCTGSTVALDMSPQRHVYRCIQLVHSLKQSSDGLRGQADWVRAGVSVTAQVTTRVCKQNRLRQGLKLVHLCRSGNIYSCQWVV